MLQTKNKPIPQGAPTQEWLESAAIGAPNAYIVNVTPEMAKIWLQQNIVDNRENRRFRRNHANTFAEEMRRGEWKLTHQGIAFGGASGRLLDGQHRLAAIVASGTTQPLLVFIDTPEETYDNHDRGATRNMSDILMKNRNVVSIGTGMVRLCKRGAYTKNRNPLPAEVDRVLKVFAPDIMALMDASTNNRAKRTLAPAKIAWLIHYHGANEEDRKLLKQQWKAFAEYDPKRMDESTASGDNRLELMRTYGGGQIEIEVACIGWLMFDPARRNLSRIVVKNTATAMDELCAAACAIIPELTPENAAEGVELPKKLRGWADPEIGPVLRARAQAAILAKKMNGATPYAG